MRTHLKLGWAVVLVLAVATATAHADLLAYEPFDYAEGTVASASGGVGWTGAWNSSVDVVSPGLTQGALEAVGGRMTAGGGGRNFATGATGVNSGSLWISFLAETPAGSEAVVGLTNSSWSQISFGKAAWYHEYVCMGIGSHVSANDTQGLILGRVDFNAADDGVSEVVRMWAFPIGGADFTSQPSDASANVTATTNGDFGTIFWIRTGLGGGASLDEIRIGTTYESVVPIPEPTSLAMLAAAGFGMLRRRR